MSLGWHNGTLQDKFQKLVRNVESDKFEPRTFAVEDVT